MFHVSFLVNHQGGSMIKRVHWTEEELDIIKERLIEILKKDPHTNKLDGFRQAQDILDPERQRKLSSLVNISKPKFEQVWRSAHKKASVLEKSGVSEEDNTVFVPVPVAPSLSEISDHALLAEAFLRILNILKPDKVSPVKEDLSKHTESNGSSTFDKPSQYTQRNKPKVGIVGLLKDQFNNIKARVNQSKVELVYFDKDKGYAFNTYVDYVLVQKHTSHGHYYNARDKFGNDKVFFVSGGISQCAEKVNELYPGSLN